MKRSVDLLRKVQLVVLDNLITNEESVTVHSDVLSLQVEKIAMRDFGQKENKLGDSRFKPPPVSAFGLEKGLSSSRIFNHITNINDTKPDS